MNFEDMILISVDDHVIEPPEMFANHVPAKFKDRAPKIVKLSDGGDLWTFEDVYALNVGLNATAGCPPEEYGLDPTEYAQMRPGCYDIHERVRDMSAGGVLGGMSFPTFPQFCGQYFLRAKDKELSLACLKAYNDWHIHEWAGAYPDRILPIALPVLWDPELAAQEVRRVAALGVRAVTFSENPHKLGLPEFHSDHWDPFFKACTETGVVVCLHIGSSSTLNVPSPSSPPEVLTALMAVNSIQAVVDLIFSQIVVKFPELQFAISEGSNGWVPYFLERSDSVYEKHRCWTHTDLRGRMPSEVFQEQMWTCFITDPVGIRLRDEIGVDRMMWESDYPHSDSQWPDAAELLWKHLDGVSDEHIEKITHRNAMRCFGFDPFATRSRESCTVGALRAEAADVSTEEQSMGRRRSESLAASSLTGTIAATFGNE